MTSVTAERSESIWWRLVYNKNDQLMVAGCAIIVEESVALGWVDSAIKELIDDTAKRHIILVSE